MVNETVAACGASDYMDEKISAWSIGRIEEVCAKNLTTTPASFSRRLPGASLLPAGSKNAHTLRHLGRSRCPERRRLQPFPARFSQTPGWLARCRGCWQK